MTIAAGADRLPAAQLQPRGWRREEARSRAGRARRRRRPGGASARRCRASARSPARPGRWSGAPTRSGCPIVVTEQYPQGLGATAPEVAEHLPDGVEPIDEDPLLGRRGGRASTSAAATRRSSAGSRPTSASTRRSSTCSTTASRSTSSRDAVGSRTEENRELGLHRAERAGAVLTSVETALFELLGEASDARVQAGPGAGQVSAMSGYVLLEDGTRFDGELCGDARGGPRRGRLQHLDDRLPGGGHRPLLRGPDHHLHLSADRQLRRLAPRRWSPTASTPAR